MNDIPAFVRDDLARLGIALPDEALPTLAKYLALLLGANEQFNLTAIREPEAAWRRHVIDSLTILPGLDQLPAGASVIDVGSGGGLPGIPLAVARPDLTVTLLESTGKKATFLRRCVAETPLPNVKVVQERAEIAGQDRAHRQAYSAVVCRAIGPMREVLEYTLPLAKLGGVVLAMKGPKAEAELDEAADALDTLGAGEIQVFDAYPEGFDQNTVGVSVTKERPTPKAYPRRPGVPRQSPL
jgi:16S rRNA (guanine527-N7)-methyltransferase